MNHILLVDDSDVSTLALTAQLVDHGYRVTSVASAEEALLMIDTHPPQAVVTDLCMPDIEDGVAFICELRKRHPKIPIACLSSSPRPRDMELPHDVSLTEKHGTNESMEHVLAWLWAPRKSLEEETRDAVKPIRLLGIAVVLAILTSSVALFALDQYLKGFVHAAG